MTATFIARLSIGHQRTARTGDARLSVRQSALCRMGFGQTHGAHGIFLTKEKYQCRCRPSPSPHPRRIAPTFSRGRARRAFCGVPCAPWDGGARWGVRCRAAGVRRCGGRRRCAPTSPPRPRMWPVAGRLQRLGVAPIPHPGRPALTSCGLSTAAFADPITLTISMNIKEFRSMKYRFMYAYPQWRSASSPPACRLICIKETRHAKR